MTQATYQTAEITVKGNTYSVLKVTGGCEGYISVRKETNNPYKLAGKQFENEESVLAHYKSVAMKFALIQALNELKN